MRDDEKERNSGKGNEEILNKNKWEYEGEVIV